jgi:hypothetical protein
MHLYDVIFGYLLVNGVIVIPIQIVWSNAVGTEKYESLLAEKLEFYTFFFAHQF